MSNDLQKVIDKANITILVQKKIKKEGSKWCVYSENGKKMGCYKTKAEAVERLRQIEGHKKNIENRDRTEKGLPAGMSEGGLHIHGLERDSKKTKEDGAHEHIFLVTDADLGIGDPTDSYEFLLYTDLCGEHVHKLTSENSNTIKEGEHFHTIYLPSGEIIKTTKDGGHRHELQVATTGLDGIHTHELKLSKNTVKSLSPAQVWEVLLVKPTQKHLPPLPPVHIFEQLSDEAYGALKYAMYLSRREEEKEENKEKREESKNVEKLESEHKFRILKAEGDDENPDEERIIFGVVLVPGDTDAQDDVYDEEAVRKAAYSFMEIYGGKLKVMHRGKPLNDGSKVLETYLSKQEEIHGDETFPQTTWFLTIRGGETIWDEVKKGTYTGFSMGGTAIKESLEEE